MRRVAFGVFTALTLLGGCSRNGGEYKSPLGYALVKVTLGSKSYTLEVADNEKARQYGLMKRDSMPADVGMIFVFPFETPRGFYMRNTRIPLDIIYLAANGTVVSIKTMTPFDEASVPSDGPAQYAIELNAGQAAQTGLKPGDRVTLPSGLSSKD